MITPGMKIIEQQIRIAENNLASPGEPYPGYKETLRTHIDALKADLKTLETGNNGKDETR